MSQSIRPTLAALGLALSLQAQAAQTVQPVQSGSLRFDLTRPENADGAIDLFAALAARPQTFTQVRATFTAEVMGAFWGDAPALSDYALLLHERHNLGLPQCAGSTQYWCLDERWVFERSAVTTMAQSESWLRATIGSASGRASTADVPAATRVEDQGTVLDSSATTHSVEPFSIDYDADGNIERIRYMDWYKTQQYQTHSFMHWVYSPVTTLSVTLDLGADELAALSRNGQLSFNAGYNQFAQAPTLRLDYTAIPAVPEPQTWLLCALGLAGMALRRGRARRLAVAFAAMLGLMASNAQAVEIQGSARFDLDVWGSRPGEFDLSRLPDLQPGMQLTQVRATFSTQVVSTTWDSTRIGDYRETRHKREDWGQPLCHWQAVVWCISETWTYQRESVKTLTQDDRTAIDVRVGSASGQDGLKGTLTTQWREDLGVKSDATYYAIDQIPYVADWFDESGRPTKTTKAHWHQWREYQTHSFVDYVLSSKTRLSVTLDLDAASLAELSSSGVLRYAMNAFGQTYRPELQLDYVAISAVPEPAAWLLQAAGLAAVLGWRRRSAVRSVQRPPR